MITQIAQFALLVRDYEEAIAYYCDILGFEKVMDQTVTSQKRFVQLAAPGRKGSNILLTKINSENEKELEALGNQAGGRVLIYLTTDNFEADYQSLKAKGAMFTEIPRSEVYGKVAVMQDLYGNRIDLIQPATIQ